MVLTVLDPGTAVGITGPAPECGAAIAMPLGAPAGDEEDHQLSKQVSGLDSGQVTTWTSWHRWTAISLLACAFLAVAAA
jgi:hypothetical protein